MSLGESQEMNCLARSGLARWSREQLPQEPLSFVVEVKHYTNVLINQHFEMFCAIVDQMLVPVEQALFGGIPLLLES